MKGQLFEEARACAFILLVNIMCIDLSAQQHAVFPHMNRNSITAASVQLPIKANVIMFHSFKVTRDYTDITVETTVITGEVISSEKWLSSGLMGSVITTNVTVSVSVFLLISHVQ